MPSVGDWFENVKTGERACILVAPEDNDGAYLKVDLWLQPGAAVVGAHVHDNITERFTMVDGEVVFVLGKSRQPLGAGEVAEIPAGTVHDWWNAGTSVAHVVVEVEALPGSGPAAARFVEAIEAAFGLANSGHTFASGRPHPLWLASVATEYRDVLRFVSPPALVQRVTFALLRPLARLLGRDAAGAWLHGDSAPARRRVEAGRC